MNIDNASARSSEKSVNYQVEGSMNTSDIIRQTWSEPKTRNICPSEANNTANQQKRAEDNDEVRTSKDLSPEERKELHERLMKLKEEKEARDAAKEKVNEWGKNICQALGFGECEIFDSNKNTAGKQHVIDTKDSHFGRHFPASPENIKKKFQELYNQ